jgi:hypothetical protein
MSMFAGTYGGIVRDNKDKLKLGRLKVHVPLVYGVASATTAQLGVGDLPWALPAGMPAGGSAASGGLDWLPNPGDQVWVRFLNGEPEHPIWEWGNQNIDQAKAFQLHDYGKDGKPQRGALTRYGHTLDFTDGALILTTKHGYTIRITDGEFLDGEVVLQTPAGHKISINDEEQVVSLRSTAGQAVELDDLAESVRVMANQDLDLQALDEINIQAADVRITALGTEVLLTVGATTARLADDELTLGVGPNVLTISPAGFDFTGV